MVWAEGRQPAVHCATLRFAGPDRSGKTNLIRALTTLLRISEGTGLVLEADVTSDQVLGHSSGRSVITYTLRDD